MLIILRQDLEKIGKAGDVVKVKDGYARNYLIPQNIAFPATDNYINRFNESTKSKKFKEQQMKKSAEFLKKSLEEKTVRIEMKVGEDKKLFGSVTSQRIADTLKEMGFEIDKKKIHLEDHIKHLGNFKIPYKAHSAIEIMISLEVLPEGGILPEEVKIDDAEEPAEENNEAEPAEEEKKEEE